MLAKGPQHERWVVIALTLADAGMPQDIIGVITLRYFLFG